MRFEDDVDAQRVKLQKRRMSVQQRLSSVEYGPERKALLDQLDEIDFAQKRLKSARPSREHELLDLIRRHKAMTLSVGGPGQQDLLLWEALDK